MQSFTPEHLAAMVAAHQALQEKNNQMHNYDAGIDAKLKDALGLQWHFASVPAPRLEDDQDGLSVEIIDSRAPRHQPHIRILPARCQKQHARYVRTASFSNHACSSPAETHPAAP